LNQVYLKENLRRIQLEGNILEQEVDDQPLTSH